jgi:hypothetical protein
VDARVKRSAILSGCVVALLTAACTPTSRAAPNGRHPQVLTTTTAPATDPALQVPATYPASCADQVRTCSETVPMQLRDAPLRFPKLTPGEACPTSSGSPSEVPTVGGTIAGTVLGGGPVDVVLSQGGDLSHGVVDVASSNVPGWYGIKTEWNVEPSYRDWVVIRAKRLDDSGPIAALGNATIGPIVIPPGPSANGINGWREQPVGTYVKGPGCYGWQVDGMSFTEEIVVDAVLAPAH